MELRKVIRKKLNGMIFVVIIIAMLKGQVFAVSSEDLANPVRDASTHSLEYEKKVKVLHIERNIAMCILDHTLKEKLETLLL